MNHSPLPIPIVLVFDALVGCTQHCATLISGAANVVPMSRDSMDLSRRIKNSWIFTKGPMNSSISAFIEFRIFHEIRLLSFCGVGPHRPSTGARSGNRLPARVSGYSLNFVHTGRRGLCPMQS